MSWPRSVLSPLLRKHLCLCHCFLAFSFSGCSTSRTVHRPLSVEDRGELENVEPRRMEMTYFPNRPVDSAPVTLDVAQFRLRGDALEFLPARSPPGADVQQVPVAALRSIVVVDSRRGSVEGAGLGLLIGALGGAAVGFSFGSDPPGRPFCVDSCISFPASFKAGVGAIIGGLIGLGAGIVTGSIIGHTNTTRFEERVVEGRSSATRSDAISASAREGSSLEQASAEANGAR